MSKSRLHFQIAISSVVFLLAICSTSLAADANTVGLWHFNEGSGQVASDASGNGNEGVLGANNNQGNDDPEWIADGYAGSALGFNNAQYVSIQNDGSFDLPEGTIELWFKLYTPINGSVPWNQMIGKAASDASNFYLGIGENPPGKLRFKMENNNDEESIASDSDQWNADQWYFVAATFGGDGLKLYIDGVLQQNTSPSTNSLADIEATTIGIGYDVWPGAPDYFEGVIDEVRISSVARDEDELGNYTAAPVEPLGKVAVTWAGIKARY